MIMYAACCDILWHVAAKTTQRAASQRTRTQRTASDVNETVVAEYTLFRFHYNFRQFSSYHRGHAPIAPSAYATDCCWNFGSGQGTMDRIIDSSMMLYRVPVFPA